MHNLEEIYFNFSFLKFYFPVNLNIFFLSSVNFFEFYFDLKFYKLISILEFLNHYII